MFRGAKTKGCDVSPGRNRFNVFLVCQFALDNLRFYACYPIVGVMIEGALALGLQRAAENGRRTPA
jgi:hypothetical protein